MTPIRFALMAIHGIAALASSWPLTIWVHDVGVIGALSSPAVLAVIVAFPAWFVVLGWRVRRPVTPGWPACHAAQPTASSSISATTPPCAIPAQLWNRPGT